MTDEVKGPTTKGTEGEILTALWNMCFADIDSIAVTTAVRRIRQGYDVVELCGERYEVTGPEWTVEQDVYGCEHGRECQDVTPAEREVFEAMIAARLAGG